MESEMGRVHELRRTREKINAEIGMLTEPACETNTQVAQCTL